MDPLGRKESINQEDSQAQLSRGSASAVKSNFVLPMRTPPSKLSSTKTLPKSPPRTNMSPLPSHGAPGGMKGRDSTSHVYPSSVSGSLGIPWVQKEGKVDQSDPFPQIFPPKTQSSPPQPSLYPKHLSLKDVMGWNRDPEGTSEMRIKCTGPGLSDQVCCRVLAVLLEGALGKDKVSVGSGKEKGKLNIRLWCESCTWVNPPMCMCIYLHRDTESTPWENTDVDTWKGSQGLPSLFITLPPCSLSKFVYSGEERKVGATQFIEEESFDRLMKWEGEQIRSICQFFRVEPPPPGSYPLASRMRKRLVGGSVNGVKKEYLNGGEALSSFQDPRYRSIDISRSQEKQGLVQATMADQDEPQILPMDPVNSMVQLLYQSLLLNAMLIVLLASTPTRQWFGLEVAIHGGRVEEGYGYERLMDEWLDRALSMMVYVLTDQGW
ncbi:hypothetical protein BJ684DRAFT_16534 [Piptocephalis cylindrospora]|uniref:Uncharacterized protein n=1 Tax=Piptocephalis cylindrospora TaxID=1907219 RepID=A0A4V1IY20_9FUNG|nr:hypothetical protein BJ684DRAFT_16534 [Piptocephalis cylindrospora]|eukprot:RKP13029.1 hypothetical protein BJ684DRAFT_16534 [Piptocephalis cylindrospora]